MCIFINGLDMNENRVCAECKETKQVMINNESCFECSILKAVEIQKNKINRKIKFFYFKILSIEILSLLPLCCIGVIYGWKIQFVCLLVFIYGMFFSEINGFLIKLIYGRF